MHCSFAGVVASAPLCCLPLFVLTDNISEIALRLK